MIVLFNVIDEIMEKIGEYLKGYMYLLGCVGVIGVEIVVNVFVLKFIECLNKYKVVLVLLGFGIFMLE